jgi:hypothetical protein
VFVYFFSYTVFILICALKLYEQSTSSQSTQATGLHFSEQNKRNKWFIGTSKGDLSNSMLFGRRNNRRVDQLRLVDLWFVVIKSR